MELPVARHVGRVVLGIDGAGLQGQIDLGDGHGHGRGAQCLGQDLERSTRWHAHLGAGQVRGLFDLFVVGQVDGARAQVGRVQNHQAHLGRHIVVVLLANVAAEGLDQVVGIAKQVGRTEHTVLRQLGLDLKGDRAGHLQVTALHGWQLGALAKQRAGGMQGHLDGPGELGLHARLDHAESVRQRCVIRRRRRHPNFGLGLGHWQHAE